MNKPERDAPRNPTGNSDGTIIVFGNANASSSPEARRCPPTFRALVTLATRFSKKR
jgi:hypothetical protein